VKREVSIVIPNYNGAELLKHNLPSVIDAASTYQKSTLVIVVDDGSKDESVGVLKKHFPQVKIVVHPQNRGFSEAVYSGVKAADTELIFLLNSDVQPDVRCIEVLTKYFDVADTFAVGPLIVDEVGKVNRHSWNIREFNAGSLKPIDWDLDRALEARHKGKLPTLYVSGGSVMLRKSMFMSLDGFHPLFKPFYGEDYDLGLRAWRHGWRSFFEPSVSIIHQHHGSIKDNVKREYVKRIRRRNKLLLEWIHLPAWRLWATVIPLSVWQLLGELLLLDKVNVLGFYDALGRIPAVLRERSKLDRMQTQSIEQVLELVNVKLNRNP
jgi:GT2 family glycosyltransferase